MTSCICQDPQHIQHKEWTPMQTVGPQLIIMYPYWFINCSKRATLMQDINNTGNCVWERRNIGNISQCLLLSFSINLKLMVQGPSFHPTIFPSSQNYWNMMHHPFHSSLSVLTQSYLSVHRLSLPDSESVSCIC